MCVENMIKKFLAEIWKDPVWSKVIAAVITAAPVIIARFFDGKLANWLNLHSIPNFATLGFMVAFLFGCAWFNIKSKSTKGTSSITSDEWFNTIADKLSDCESARIYLRSFDHPDNFREEHRKALMRILEAIKIKLKNNADIKIISFNPTEEKSGVDWLRNELSEEICAATIKIYLNQPVSNGSSMYLFDDKTVAYNRKNGKINFYFIENYSNSIVHEMLYRGFNDLQRVTS